MQKIHGELNISILTKVISKAEMMVGGHRGGEVGDEHRTSQLLEAGKESLGEFSENSTLSQNAQAHAHKYLPATSQLMDYLKFIRGPFENQLVFSVSHMQIGLTTRTCDIMQKPNEV